MVSSFCLAAASACETRLLELTLGNLELVGDNLQIALEIRIGFLVLRNAILQTKTCPAVQTVA